MKERAESEGEERGATGRLRGVARRPGEEAGGGQGERVHATASCSYWQEEDDAVGWWVGLSTVLGQSWAD